MLILGIWGMIEPSMPRRKPDDDDDGDDNVFEAFFVDFYSGPYLFDF